MLNTPPPIPFGVERARRLLLDVVSSAEGLSLGSLAAELDLAPPEALAQLHALVVQDHLPICAELAVACGTCGESLESVRGLAAWVLASVSYAVPCACGETTQVEPSYLDLVLQPDTKRPAIDLVLGTKRVAEMSRSRSKTLDRDAISAIQLSFDWGLAQD